MMFISVFVVGISLLKVGSVIIVYSCVFLMVFTSLMMFISVFVVGISLVTNVH